MKKFMAGFMGFLMIGMIAVEADAASRSSSSRSVSRPSVSKTYSAPAKATYTAPKQQAGTSSNPGLKALGFGKPASAQTPVRPSAGGSLNLNKAQPVTKTTTTSGGWFGKKSVSSAPATAYKAPVRKVVSPTAYKTTYRSQPTRNVTVIQKNYYGGRSYGGYNGYNRGYGGYNNGGYYGNSGMGSSIMGGALGAFGGMMIYDALTNNETQNLENKVDKLLENQQAANQQIGALENQLTAVPQPQCYMPEDAPLMMNPQFYCGGLNAK